MRKRPFPVVKYDWLLILLGVIVFTPMFVIQHIGNVDFWWWMSLNLMIMTALAFLTDPPYLPSLGKDLTSDIVRKLLIALASVVVLYFVFYAGNRLSRQWFAFAGNQISGIYHFRGEASSLRIILLMALVIGPGEELFWRGFVQRHLSSRYRKQMGFLLATLLYTAVHLATGNLMLVLAALICVIFWGWLYHKYHSMLINMLSHTLWDIAVFVVLPFS
ncbi:MAG: type II CAAX endopeptidase family protein [Bacteroidales bacterium]|nr:type II CAAX endopeptidase family protein [Bacteroidales bacterium]